MYTKLSNAKLKTGEDIEIGLVLAPDQEHSDAIAKVLHHKGDPWLSHVSRALSGDIKELETRLYTISSHKLDASSFWHNVSASPKTTLVVTLTRQHPRRCFTI